MSFTDNPEGTTHYCSMCEEYAKKLEVSNQEIEKQKEWKAHYNELLASSEWIVDHVLNLPAKSGEK